jgi:competence protein ComEC
LMTVLTLIRSSRNRLIFLSMLAGILCWEHFATEDPGIGKLRVTLLSMGQAESTLIRFPDGTCMLVDGGGSLHEGGIDAGERLLAPALRSMGINRINWIVLSHGHPDHLKGLLFIASAFPVGEFWESGYSFDSPAYLELKRVLASKNVPVRILDETTRPIQVGGAVIEPLAPPMSNAAASALPSQEWDVNDESLVFRLSMGRFSMLFTGDSGFAAEARLLRAPRRISSTVLKVAHHGSRHSSSIPFLRAVSPRLALISAGYGNNFHLPAQETVDDLKKVGAEIYRTDMDGSIELTVNPASGTITVRKISGAIH